jgi:DEAD/DEAH box helicase domain-containing protein
MMVLDPTLYSTRARLPEQDRNPDFKTAIGSIKTTDVTLISIESDNLPGPDRVVVTSPSILPAGLSALWSFAELFRISAAAELDVSPNELQVGLHPLAKGSSETRRIFIADALENGAGYAAKLADPEIVNAIMQRILGEIGPQWQAHKHISQCDSSCPDCLRSYDNRLLHSVLDWRLALDLAEIAAGVAPDVDRWLGMGSQTAEQLAQTFGTDTLLEVKKLGKLAGVYGANQSRMAIFSHPLWRQEEPFWTLEQRVAREAAVKMLGREVQVRFVDPHDHRRHPHRAFVWLAGAA